MEPLIKITNVPISFEFKVNDARLEYSSATADVEVSRSGEGLQIRSRPIKLNLDTFEARNSVSPSPRRSIEQAAQRGKTAVYEATARMAEEGALLLNAKFGEDVLGRIAASSTEVSADFGLAFTPTTGPEISWSEPDLTIEYQMDKLNFDWKISNGNFEFIPGNIELLITQYPSVIIEYIGGPIYVPASADPDYVPLDVKA